jgi:hypothetical protein
MKSTPPALSSSTVRVPSAALGYGRRTWKAGHGIVQHRVGNDHSGTQQLAGGDPGTPLFEGLQIAAHIAHARDAICHKQRQRHLLIARAFN